jgi:hypothetical protein
MWGITIGVGIMLMLYYSIVVAGDGLDPEEPPMVRTRIPFVGHIIEMLRYQTYYLENLRYDILILSSYEGPPVLSRD